MNYIYTLETTEGATGFASCLPDPPLDLSSTVDMLKQRPLDTFLHRHALRLLAASPEQWQRLAASADSIIAILLLELMAIKKDARQNLALQEARLREICQPWIKNTPEIILWRDPHGRALRQKWHDNIHQHGPVPPLPPESEEMSREKERLASSGHRLAKLYASAPQALASQERDPAQFLKYVDEILTRHGPPMGPEMRHEASLSPIALLRSWRLEFGVAGGRNAHSIRGEATAYGRGLKLVQARISCRMEIIERYCAHAQADAGRPQSAIGGMQCASWAELSRSGIAATTPSSLGAPPQADGFPLHWLPAEDARGNEIFVPAQAAYLFCNLDEMAIFEHMGSTGLASGATVAGARLHALLEVVER